MTYFFTSESLYFLIPFTHFIYPSTILLVGNHQSVLYEFCFVVAFIFPCVNEIIWYLPFFVWLISLSITLSVHTTQLKIYTCTNISLYIYLHLSSVQSLSHVSLFMTPWTAACQASLSCTISRSLPKFMSIESVIPSSHHILCCLLLSAFNLSQHQSLFK